MIKLSPEQNTVLESLLDWNISINKSPTITVGGYAGTGKTT